MESIIRGDPEKCTIKNLDTGATLHAHFNPTELSLSKQVPWSEHDSSKGDNPTLEFTKASPMELDVELLFDTYESRMSVYDEYVEALIGFTLVNESKKRPPMVRFAWGDEFPDFIGVITSLSTKYTMFFRNGRPCRATCSIKMKQAESVEVSGEGNQTPEQKQQSSPGTTVQQGDEMRADKLGDDHRKQLEASGSEDGRLTPGQQAPTET